jgi:hypothetical protein
MPRTFADNARSIGGTLLVQLNRVTSGCRAKVFAYVRESWVS